MLVVGMCSLGSSLKIREKLWLLNFLVPRKADYSVRIALLLFFFYPLISYLIIYVSD